MILHRWCFLVANNQIFSTADILGLVFQGVLSLPLLYYCKVEYSYFASKTGFIRISRFFYKIMHLSMHALSQLHVEI
jgi:hypothetical protein